MDVQAAWLCTRVKCVLALSVYFLWSFVLLCMRWQLVPGVLWLTQQWQVMHVCEWVGVFVLIRCGTGLDRILQNSWPTFCADAFSVYLLWLGENQQASSKSSLWPHHVRISFWLCLNVWANIGHLISAGCLWWIKRCGETCSYWKEKTQVTCYKIIIIIIRTLKLTWFTDTLDKMLLWNWWFVCGCV